MNILITGASDGIGLEVAKLLAARNHEITLVSRNKDKLEKAVSLLHGKGHKLIVADLSSNEEVDNLKSVIESNRYDVFINNAGVGMYGRFTEMSLATQVNMMNLNISAVTALSYFYLHQARKGDALVNVASTLGTTSYAGAAVYAASKAYVINLSEALWWEYKAKGVYVFGFCPGPTFTEFHNIAGGDKNSFPKFIMQSAQQVAQELVNALEKRKKPKVVSGATNRFMISFQKLLSRKMVVSMMAGFGPLKGEEKRSIS